MTAREKAEELILKYLRLQDLDSYNWFDKLLAKNCALISVTEILELPFEFESERKYWKAVKSEIENL